MQNPLEKFFVFRKHKTSYIKFANFSVVYKTEHRIRILQTESTLNQFYFSHCFL